MKLRELEKKDVDGMLEWMYSELSKKVFEKDFNSFTKEDVTNFVENANAKDNEINYACVDDNDEYLGTISLKNIDYKNKNAEYAISFREKAHGSGATVFATEEILNKAFNELGLETVYLNVLKINERANAFYKKMGFVKENTYEKDHIMKNGESYDLLWYDMNKKEYEEKYNKHLTLRKKIKFI